MKGKEAMGTTTKGGWRRCFHDHPALTVGEHVIYGGSCLEPAVLDADVYVGLDHGMKMTKRHYPWREGTEVKFVIPDMGVPSNVEDFKALIGWLSTQLAEGRKVHVGCIGGHGRTGMVLSALVKTMTGNEDATAYVRKHYCEKAVESQKQVDWLHKHFGIKKIKASKAGGGFITGGTPVTRKGSSSFDNWSDDAMFGTSRFREAKGTVGGSDYDRLYTSGRDTMPRGAVPRKAPGERGQKATPVKSSRNIW
jgi:hypothetical protein